MPDSFTLFETPLGTGAIAWNERGVSGVQLPEPDAARVRARLKRRFPDSLESAPAPAIRQAIDGITALLRGEPSDLSGVHLDMDRVDAFERGARDHARRDFCATKIVMRYEELYRRTIAEAAKHP